MKIKLTLLATFVSAFVQFLPAAEPLQIAVITKSTVSEYWGAVRAGALKAQTDLALEGVQVNVLWASPAREDQLDEQKRIVSAFVTRKVDAIVLAPIHAQALVATVDEALAAKIPVTIIDSPLASERIASTVATNNYKAGLLAGRRLAESLGGKGKVALFRFMKGHGSTQPRESGFLDAMKKFPEIQVVDSAMHAGATVAEAEKNASQLLQRVGPGLNGVFASNLIASSGMLHALRSAGLAGKLSFVGFDSSDESVEAMRKGEMSGFAVQQPFMMGYLGVRTAVAMVQGKPVGKEVDTDVMIVTLQNLDTPEVKKLLNPSDS